MDVMFILQMRKLRHEEIMFLNAQVHTASQAQSLFFFFFKSGLPPSGVPSIIQVIRLSVCKAKAIARRNSVSISQGFTMCESLGARAR